MTPIDTRPPKISDIQIETSNIDSQKENKAQVVVGWKTDEFADSTIEYGEGLYGNDFTRKTVTDDVLAEKHLVIITDLEPSKTYHLRVVSKDKASNIAKSESQSLVSGEANKSVLEIILETLEKVFGWLGKII